MTCRNAPRPSTLRHAPSAAALDVRQQWRRPAGSHRVAVSVPRAGTGAGHLHRGSWRTGGGGFSSSAGIREVPCRSARDQGRAHGAVVLGRGHPRRRCSARGVNEFRATDTSATVDAPARSGRNGPDDQTAGRPGSLGRLFRCGCLANRARHHRRIRPHRMRLRDALRAVVRVPGDGPSFPLQPYPRRCTERLVARQSCGPRHGPCARGAVCAAGGAVVRVVTRGAARSAARSAAPAGAVGADDQPPTFH